MKVIFMGTPDFSVGTLQALLDAGHQVVLAVTQPDKPKGRGNHMQMSPVKELALENDIPVYQPQRIRDPQAWEILRQYPADIAVVVAFGQILPPEVLDLPRLGCINVHASLLPKYRGSSPIQWALLNADAVTGVTTMQMDAGMDTGDILLQEKVEIAPDETAGTLFDKLSAVGAALCVRTLDELLGGQLQPQPQDGTRASYTKMISKTDGEIDFTQSAAQIQCRIRAMSPWPSAYTRLGNKTLKIWQARTEEGGSGKKPGTIVEITKDDFTIQTGQGLLRVIEVQLEGKKRMDAAAFLRGNALTEGTVL